MSMHTLPTTLSHLCQNVFLSLPRSDQRRWGEAYVHGLVSVPGRKSIRRISEHIVGQRVDQCLQQFVNQSPWRWEPVRLRLAQVIAAAIQPKAWVIEDVAFGKNGDNSAGVARQYVPSAGRTMNCQLALAACLTSERGSFPVNWRLMLPPAWDTDVERRRRCHMPDTEAYRPRWQHVVDLLDEMIVGWDMTPPAVLLDCVAYPNAEQLLRALEARGLRYAVRVREDTPAFRHPTVPNRVVGVAELARSASCRRASLTVPVAVNGRLVRSQFAAIPVPGTTEPQAILPGGYWRRTRRLVVEWRLGRSGPHTMWLTNLNTSRLPELVNLLELAPHTRRELDSLNDGSGLQHFEGRSFRGWHHHVTLASLAHAYRSMAGLTERDDLLEYERIG